MSPLTYSPNLLPAVELNPDQPPQASIIWLHGLGADGHDFVPIVQELDLPAGIPVRFIFPHAPEQAVTINGGYIMRAWYDIRTPDLQQQEDAAGIRASAAAVTRWIQHEQTAGIPAARIFLAGFSQGGAIALYTALTQPAKLGGVIALSTYLPLADSLAASLQGRDTGQLPVFMAHGTQDTIVPFSAGKASAQQLQEWGYTVDFHTYAMAHSVNEGEISAISTWLNAQLTRGITQEAKAF